MVHEINGSLDLTSGEVTALLDLQLRRLYDPKHRYNLTTYYNPLGLSLTGGYGRQFGQLVDFFRMNHYLEISDNYLFLNSGFSSEDDSATSGIANTLILYYGFSSTLSYKNPEGGWSTGTFLEYGSEYTLSDYEILRLGWSTLKIIQLVDEHLLVLRAKVSSAMSATLPDQKYFSLGGLNGVRGISFSDADFVGKNRAFGSAEYRHRLVSNLNWNFFNLFRIRKIQGAAFIDVGQVNDTLTDRRALEDDPTYVYDDSFWELFTENTPQISAGYSWHLFIDALGIRETLLRFDLGQSLTDLGETGPRTYFAFDQAF
jgi:hypothetical protein